jgi:hypothetical protein
VTMTRYFIEQVMRKRPHLNEALCRAVVAAPIRVVEQPDGRIRHWGRIVLPDETESRIMRVVTLDDGITIHNAFLDRDFVEVEP